MSISRIWNVTEDSDPDRYQYYLGFIELVSDVSFRTNLQNFWKYQTDDTVKGVDLLQLAIDVHPTLPLKVMVSKLDKEVGLLFALEGESIERKYWDIRLGLPQ